MKSLVLFVLGISLSWAESFSVQTKIEHEATNHVAVLLKVKNQTGAPLENLKISYWVNEVDHSAPMVASVAYSNQPLLPVELNAKPNYLLEIPFELSAPLLDGDSVDLHFMYNPSDWSVFDPTNDPSYLANAIQKDFTDNAYVTVTSGYQLVYGQIPPDPIVNPNDFNLVTTTTLSGLTSTSMGVILRVRNEGTLPLRDLDVVYFANTASYQAPLQLQVDYTDITGLTYKMMENQAGITELIFNLNDEILSVGEERQIHFRYNLEGWAPIDPTQDFSYPDGQNPLNNHLVVAQCNQLLDGSAPYVYGNIDSTKIDSDLDGVVDVIETALGYDPLDAASFPWVGLPDQLYVNADGDALTVLYDFSHIPGFENSNAVEANYKVGQLEAGLVPLVEIRFDLAGYPAFAPELGFYSRNLNTIVHAHPRAGSEVTVPIPLYNDFVIRDQRAYRAFHFNELNSTWEPLVNDSEYEKPGVVPVVSQSFSPVAVTKEYFLQQISAKSNHLLWVYNQVDGAAGPVVAMGDNAAGQLGNGQLESEVTAPVSLIPQWVQGLDNAIFVAAGDDHSLAIDANYDVWAWGNNAYGQLGVVGPAQSSLPLKLDLAEDILFVGAGYGTSFAIGATGNTYVWGKNDLGQLGLGDFTSRATPELHPQKFIEIQGGFNHTVGIGIDQKIYSWGDNSVGQLALVANDLWYSGPPVATPQPVNHAGEWVRVSSRSVDYGVVGFDRNNLSVNGDRLAMARKANNNADVNTLPEALPGSTGNCIGSTYFALALGKNHCVVEINVPVVNGGYRLNLAGDNSAGQLASTDPLASVNYVSINHGGKMLSLAAGLTSTMHRRSDGSVWMAGLLDGYQTAAAGEVFVPDEVLPEIGVNELITNADAPALTGTVSEKVKAYFKIGGFEFEKALEGNWSLADELLGIAEGVYDVEVEIIDAGANHQTATFAAALTVDRTAPVITILSPTPQQNVGQVSSTLVQYKMLENGVELTRETTLPIDPTINGFVDLIVVETDAAGNEGTASVTVVAGDVAVLVSLDFAEKFTLDPNFAITGTSAKADQISVLMDGVEVCALSSALETWSCALQNLTTGIHEVKVRASNIYGSQVEAMGKLNHELSELSVVSVGIKNSPKVTSSAFEVLLNVSIPASGTLVIWNFADRSEVFRKPFQAVAGENTLGVNQGPIEVSLAKGLYGITVEAQTVGVAPVSLSANSAPDFVKSTSIEVHKSWDEIPHYKLELDCSVSKLMYTRAVKGSGVINLSGFEICANGAGELSEIYLTNLTSSGAIQSLSGNNFTLEVYEANSNSGIFEIAETPLVKKIESNFRTINPYFNEVYVQEFEMLGSYKVGLKVYQDFIAESQRVKEFAVSPLLSAGDVYRNVDVGQSLDWWNETSMATPNYAGHLVFVYEFLDGSDVKVGEVVRAVEVSGE